MDKIENMCITCGKETGEWGDFCSYECMVIYENPHYLGDVE